MAWRLTGEVVDALDAVADEAEGCDTWLHTASRMSATESLSSHIRCNVIHLECEIVCLLADLRKMCSNRRESASRMKIMGLTIINALLILLQVGQSVSALVILRHKI
jgi:heme A synthase